MWTGFSKRETRVPALIKLLSQDQSFLPPDLDYIPGIWIPPTSVVHRRETVIRVGGWRHFRDVPDVDPEADLWRRIYHAGYSIRITRRLTAVKFSASDRKEVYAIRPIHEQSSWAERINSEPDFAAVELARMLKVPNKVDKPTHDGSFKTSARHFLNETSLRIRKRLFGSAPPSIPQPSQTREQIYAERLKFKGINPPK